MLALVLTAALGASPGPVNLAAPPFHGLNVPQDALSYFSEHFAQQLTIHGIKVLTPADVAALLGLERQREVLGCTETSCLTDVVGALGADGILTSSLGKVEGRYQLDMKVVANNGAVLSARSASAVGDGALLAELDQSAKAIADELVSKLHRERLVVDAAKVPAAKPPPSVHLESGSHAPPLATTILAAVGIVALGTGGYFVVAGNSKVDDIRTADPSAVSHAQVLDWAKTASAEQRTGTILLGLGAAAAISSVTVWALHGSSSSQVALTAAPSASGAMVIVGGRWP